MTSMRLGLRHVLPGVLLIVAGGDGSAQQAARVALSPGSRTVFSPNAAITAAAVVVPTSPPAFETVEVHRPAELPPGGDIEFLVTQSSPVRILGRLSGTLAASGDESLLLTIAVPATMRAGTQEAARVRFTTGGAVPVDVPVQLTVAPTTNIDLVVSGGERRVLAGGRLAVDYAVVNAGNRTEQIEVRAVAPPGWIVQPPDERLTLELNQVAERRVEVVVPDAATGAGTVLLIASLEGTPVATARVSVLVLAPSSRSTTGSVLTTALTLADGPHGATRAWSAAIDGKLSPGIRVNGTASNPSSITSVNPALYRVGAWQQPAFLSLHGDSWTVAAGHRGFRFGELTGSTVTGNGVLAGITHDQWSVTSVHAGPSWGNRTQREGILSGATMHYDAAGVTLSASGSRLREEGAEPRRLDAFGLGAMVPSLANGRLSAEVAHRRYVAGAGLGMQLEYDRRTPDDNLSLRLMRAPGGRSGFALATDQVNASVGRRLGSRLGVFADYWRFSDSGGRSRLHSSGASASSRISVTRQVVAGIGVRQSEFHAGGASGAIRSSAHTIEASLDANAGLLSANLRSSVGTSQRAMRGGDGADVETSGQRIALDGSLGVRVGGGGTVHLSGRYDRSPEVLQSRADVGVRADRVPLLSGARWQLRASAEVRKLFIPHFETGLTSAAGLEISLPAGLTVTWVAERNPFFAMGTRGSGWSYALRVERLTNLAAMASASARGLVYRDLNDNGRRDPGEGGVAGSIVRHDGVRAVSDVDGRFTLPGVSGGEVAIDPMSLEPGWIAGQTTVSAGRREIGIVPLAPVSVVLRLADPQGIGISADTIRAVAVMARHESGRLWVARRSGADTATFDALPPGRYTLQIDVTKVGVPLVVDGGLPEFFMTSGVRQAPLRIVLMPRPLQIKRLGPPGPP